MELQFSDAELLGYLDEALGPERMSLIEGALRDSAALRGRAASLQRSRHQGHAVSEIWQRSRLSCPNRAKLASYVRQALDPAWLDYIDFHLHVVGCRYCLANVADLEQEAAATHETTRRRQKLFHSSAGQLRRD